jgi:serine/threonine-protein kinase
MVPQLPPALARVAGAALDPSGRLTLDMKIGGTVRSPQITWDADRTASRLLERGPESLLALVAALGGSVQDSVRTGQSTIDAIAGALFESQREKISQDAEQERRSSPLEELERLFHQKSKPAPRRWSTARRPRRPTPQAVRRRRPRRVRCPSPARRRRRSRPGRRRAPRRPRTRSPRRLRPPGPARPRRPRRLRPGRSSGSCRRCSGRSGRWPPDSTAKR